MSNFPTIIPALRYSHAPAAIEWLCKALGFQQHAVYANADGSIAHAQLTFRQRDDYAVVADGFGIRQVDDSARGNGRAQHAESVPDCGGGDAVYATAKANGAEIFMEIADQDYGGRAFGCRDPEGHLWNVGTYNPWAMIEAKL